MRHCRSQHLRGGAHVVDARRGRRGLGIGPAGPRKRSGDAGGGWWVARLHHSPTRGGMPKLLGAGGLHPPYDRGIYTTVQMLDEPSERATLRHISRGAVAFHGREGHFANLGSTRGSELPGERFGSRNTPWRGSYPSATMRQRFCSLCLSEVFSSGLHPGRCIGNPGRCPGNPRRCHWALLFWPFRCND